MNEVEKIERSWKILNEIGKFWTELESFEHNCKNSILYKTI